MKHEQPRLLIAGTGSGCGKTTVSSALLRAWQRQGVDLCAFKCGPDYRPHVPQGSAGAAFIQSGSILFTGAGSV